MTNRANALIRAGPAAIVSNAPSTRRGNGKAANRQPVSHHGSRPATTPGATAKKSALPAAAQRRVTAGEL